VVCSRAWYAVAMDEEEELIVIPAAGEYMTIEQAARRAGYTGAGNLRTAAARGKLRTIRINDHARITTQEWLDEYIASLDRTRGRPRKQAADHPQEETL